MGYEPSQGFCQQIFGNLPSAPSQVGNQQNTTATQQTTQQQGSLPSTSLSFKFGVVAQNQAIAFFIDQENNALIAGPDGQIIKIVKGEASILSCSAITGLISAQFSYDGKKILATFGDESNPQGSIFDVATKSWQPLQFGFKSLAWSPTNYQIVYLKQNTDYESLGILDVSSAKPKQQELIKLHASDIDLNWARPNQIILGEKSGTSVKSSVWSYDIKLKKMSLILDGYLGLESVWNETSTNVGLFFSANRSRRGGILSLVDAAGNILTRLKLATLPSKCAFNNEIEGSVGASTIPASSSSKPIAAKNIDVLYCGVPRDRDKFSLSKLPDDYEKRALFTADDIYKINLADGSTSAVFKDLDQLVDVSNPKIFGQNLFFINRIDKKIYALSLK